MYMPRRLASKFAKTSEYPLSVIEAPMGYGKTMGMRFYLKENDLTYVWQSVLDSSPDYFWSQFCRSFSAVDADIARELTAVGCPNDSVLACTAVQLMSSASVRSDTLLIIDDYQQVASEGLNRFFELFARSGIFGLHIVLMGRGGFDRSREELKLKGLLLTLTEKDFRLSEQECGDYFAVCGLKLTPAERKTAFRVTEGWISALYMSLLRYAESGEFSADDDIFRLFEDSLYEKYTADQRDFLLRIGVFREFTREQARFIRRKADPSALLDEIAETNGFIRLDSGVGMYQIHNLFADFLLSKLRQQEQSYIDEVYRNGADWYYLNREYYLATLYYYRSRDYDEMLKAFERDRAVGLSARSRKHMIAGFEKCPRPVRMKHPMANLLFARQLSMMNEKERLKKTMQELKEYFEQEPLSESRKKELRGEYLMLLSFLSYNDLDRMILYQQKASEQLSRPSLLEGTRGSWTYGSPSVLHMFYRVPGTADGLVKRMHESRSVYYRLTNKNGYGADYILEAETAYFRGCFDQAEILTYKALGMAREEKQTGIIVCALFLQTRILMMRGETEKGLEALRELTESVMNSRHYLFMHTADLCRAFICAMFHHPKSAGSWIAEGRCEESGLYHPALNFVCIVYGRILLEQEQYTKLLGERDAFLEAAREFPNLLTEIYVHIYAAVAFGKLNMDAKMQSEAEDAVSLAYQDRLYIPFVENGREFVPLLDGLFSEDDERRQFSDEVKRIYEENRKNLEAVIREEENSPLSILTKREREIALLVSEGKTNIEIAKTLNIAEITVKKSLSNIYSRLGITNRAALVKSISM